MDCYLNDVLMTVHITLFKLSFFWMTLMP